MDILRSQGNSKNNNRLM